MGRFDQLNSFLTGRITNVVSGTPVQGASNELPPGVFVTVKALNTNTGVQTIGNSSANALNTNTSDTGPYRLQPGESVSLQIGNINRIWIDATVSGEAVEFILER